MKTTDHLKGKEKTMNISIDKESSIPVYRQIEAAIKKRILLSLIHIFLLCSCPVLR